MQYPLNKQKMPRVIWALFVTFLRALTIFQGPNFSFFVNKANYDITVASKYAGPAGPPGVNSKGPHANLPLAPEPALFKPLFISLCPFGKLLLIVNS